MNQPGPDRSFWWPGLVLGIMAVAMIVLAVVLGGGDQRPKSQPPLGTTTQAISSSSVTNGVYHGELFRFALPKHYRDLVANAGTTSEEATFALGRTRIRVQAAEADPAQSLSYLAAAYAHQTHQTSFRVAGQDGVLVRSRSAGRVSLIAIGVADNLSYQVQIAAPSAKASLARRALRKLARSLRPAGHGR